MPYLQDGLEEVSPPSGVPTGERGGRLHQKEADLPLAVSPLEGAGRLVRGEVGVCRVLRCWVHYLQPRNLPQDDRLTRLLNSTVKRIKGDALPVSLHSLRDVFE